MHHEIAAHAPLMCRLRAMPAGPQPNRPRFGARKDLLRSGTDFDEPLADFAPYTG